MYNYVGKHTRFVQNYLEKVVKYFLGIGEKKTFEVRLYVEGSLDAITKIKPGGIILKCYQPCQYYEKMGHLLFICWKMPDNMYEVQ